MTTVLQSLTLQVTSTPLRLRAQLHAAWPRTAHGHRRTRAIRAITNYIKDALPDDYQGDVSVFLSNQIENAAITNQGFLYHLTQQHIVTRQPLHDADHAALLYIHYETALAMDELDDDGEQSVPVSRIEQIKQWQKETVKAVFQCMADTALSMAAQTSLRGAMAGLNKLGALLAKASSAATKHTNPVTKQTAQKAVTQEIASTLSELRSSLNVTSTNGVKPPTKAQLAIRQQLNKLNGIVPPTQKVMAKTAPTAKTVAALKAAPLLKSAALKTAISKTVAVTKSVAAQKARLQKTTVKPAAINIKALHLAINTKSETNLRSEMKASPRLVTVPARMVARVAERIVLRSLLASVLPSVPPPATRFTAQTTKAIVHKLTQPPRTQPRIAVQPHIIAQIARPAVRSITRFHISHPAIIALRVTPAIITNYIALKTPIAAIAQKTSQSAQLKSDVQKTAAPKATEPVTQKIIPPKTILPLLAKPQTQPQRLTRQPAQYAAIATPMSSHRYPPRNFSHIALAPAAISRVQIQPHYSQADSSVTLRSSALFQADTTTTSNRVASTPAYIAQPVEQPRSVPTQILTSPIETAAPITHMANIVTEEKYRDEVIQGPKQEAKVPEIKSPETKNPEIKNISSADVAKPLDSPPAVPEKNDVAQNGSLLLPTDKSITIRPVPIIREKSVTIFSVQDNAPPIIPAILVKNAEAPLLPQALPQKPNGINVEQAELSKVVPFRHAHPEHKENDLQSDKSVTSTTADIFHLRDRLPKRTTNALTEQYRADTNGLKVAVSAGTGTYRNFVSYVEDSSAASFATPEVKKASPPAERPKGQKSGQSNLGKVLEGPCG